MGSQPATTAVPAAATTTTPAPITWHDQGSAEHSAAALIEITPRLDFEMRASTNVRYHEDRQAFFEAAARWANFLVVLAGSGAASSGLAKAPDLAVYAGSVAAVVGGAQLVFDFAGKARTHLELKKAYVRLLAAAARPEAEPATLSFKLTRLFGEEPEPYHAVNALAYNATQQGYGRPSNTLLFVTRWQRLMRHLLRFDPSQFKDVSG